VETRTHSKKRGEIRKAIRVGLKKFKKMQTSLNFRKEPFALLLLTTIILLFVLALRPISSVDIQDKVMFGVPLDNIVWIIPFFLISFWLFI
jgi:hypothetical protein